jgi:hypothetical protein
MEKLNKITSINAISLGKYKLNEFTTQYGTIIFDNSKGGNISNSFIYRVGYEKYGHIDIYVDKDFKFINSIWFVSLNSEILYQDDNLDISINNNYEIPFFDTKIWNNDSENLWPRVVNDNPIEVYHNGNDCVYVTFGEKHKLYPINKNIQFQYDENNGLTGILIKDDFEIPKLIKMLRKE